MNKLIAILLLLAVLPAYCQERRPLQGHVVAGDAVANGMFVINKVTGTETKTDGKGDFCLPVKIGDALVVYSDRTDVREFAINEMSFKEVPYVMAVNAKSYELDEVVINQQVTAESLHLVPKNQKRYTVAERRLYTAGALDLRVGLGFSLSLDGILNMINGRIAMLKKALVTERKEFAMEAINGIYTDQEIRDELHIPADYVKGFVFYAVEDADCAAALKAKNDDLAKLRMMHLAPIYVKLLQEGSITTDEPKENTPINEN